MRLPGWLVNEGTERISKGLIMHVRVRLWHPGYWLARWRWNRANRRTL